MKRIIAIVLLSSMLVCLCACSSAENAAEDIINQATSLAQTNDVYIKTIQNAEMTGTTHTYKEVFDNFFAYPTWTRFTSDTDQEVVEFTGECLYDGQQVKAKIQFLITEETDDYISWEATYLSFNDVTQNRLMLSALLEKAIEECEAE